MVTLVQKNTRLPLNTQPAETGKCTPSKEVHSGDHTFHSNENRGNNVYYSVPLRSRTLKSTNPEAVACGSARQPRDVLARANEKPPEVDSNPFCGDAREPRDPGLISLTERCSSTNPAEPNPLTYHPLREITQLSMQDLINIRICTPTPEELPDPTSIFGDIFPAPTDAPNNQVEEAS
ncbi:hypothetical protein ANCCAN_04262 [Ancylostoma caninum]|uniref:Uncharacterized protein n=1 Tax=Ancylostoma caninum TaxID=29170 RepID=A0A368H1J3_ANCCA|nr:hypothetical protein ANCCAN_04262 [Ancylostoma caninum]